MGIITQQELLQEYARAPPLTVENIMAARSKEFGEEGKKVWERKYYYCDEQCWVTDRFTETMIYDPYHEVEQDGVKTLGWWMSITSHKYAYSPISNPVLRKDKWENGKLVKGQYNDYQEYLTYLNRLPATKVVRKAMRNEPWLSDAEKRREEATDES